MSNVKNALLQLKKQNIARLYGVGVLDGFFLQSFREVVRSVVLRFEMYLHFILVNVQKYDLGYVLTSLITIVVSLALAFVLHHLVAFITRFLPR